MPGDTPCLDLHHLLAQRYISCMTTTSAAQPAGHRGYAGVADNVRAELARQRWSGRAAAKAIGKSTPYMQRRLSGELPFDVEDLITIGGLLGVPATRFFAGVSAGKGRPERDSNAQPTDYIAVLRPGNTGRPPGRRDHSRPRGR